MEIRVSHELGRAEASQRLRDKARGAGIDIEHEGDSEHVGRVEQDTPLGRVGGSYVVLEETVEIRITKKPAFLPSGAVRRAVENALRELLR